MHPNNVWWPPVLFFPGMQDLDLIREMSGKDKLRYMVSTNPKVETEGLRERGGSQHNTETNQQYPFLDLEIKKKLVRKLGKILIKLWVLLNSFYINYLLVTLTSYILIFYVCFKIFRTKLWPCNMLTEEGSNVCAIQTPAPSFQLS